jgi:hypothetical protein
VGAGGGCGHVDGALVYMTTDEIMMRTAIRNAAVGVVLTVAFCGVAIFYFETGRWWFVSISLVLAAVCSLLPVRNIRVYRISQQARGRQQREESAPSPPSVTIIH